MSTVRKTAASTLLKQPSYFFPWPPTSPAGKPASKLGIEKEKLVVTTWKFWPSSRISLHYDARSNWVKLQFDTQNTDSNYRCHLALAVRSGPTYVGLSNLILKITRLRYHVRKGNFFLCRNQTIHKVEILCKRLMEICSKSVRIAVFSRNC